MKAATYVRMSTLQQEHSPAQQLAAIKRHCQECGIEIVAQFSDRGISGDLPKKRPGFLRMLEAGRWIAPLRDAGVTLETVADGPEDWDDFGGRIVAAVAAESKHQFLADLSRSVTRGLVAKAVEGRGYIGPTPYGYRRSVAIVGQSHESSLELHDEQAAVVARLFREYAKPGCSLNSLADRLNAEGVPTARGGRWRRNTVNWILRNEVYAGVAVWGQTQSGRYFTRAGETVARRPRAAAGKITAADPLRREGAVPAIVDRKTFDRVQKLLEERSQVRRGPNSIRPLSGLVRCGCGGTMHSDRMVMRCSKENEQRCTCRVSVKSLEAAVLEGLRQRLAAPEARTRLRAALERQVAAGKGGGDRADDRAALVRKHDRLAAQVAAGFERLPTLPAGLVAEFAASLARGEAAGAGPHRRAAGRRHQGPPQSPGWCRQGCGGAGARVARRIAGRRHGFGSPGRRQRGTGRPAGCRAGSARLRPGFFCRG